MHTYVTTRDLRLVYFDGSSAAKLASGSMDIVDLLIWNGFDEGRIWDEHPRIVALCEWGKRWRIDGYVRYVTLAHIRGRYLRSIYVTPPPQDANGFVRSFPQSLPCSRSDKCCSEVMMCDFEKSVELVSSVRIIPPSAPVRWIPGQPVYLDPILPSGWRGSPRSYASTVFEVVHSGSWQNHRGGEMRFRLDFSRLITFFDPRFESLVEQRRGQRREQYRAMGISMSDLGLIRSTIDLAYSDWDATGSGVDWGNMVRAIQDRYAQRLELINYLLRHGGGAVEVATRVREQILTLLTPYISFGAYTGDVRGRRDLVGPIAHRCSTTLTEWIGSRLDSSMTPSERLVKASIEDVQHEICRVISEMWIDAFAIEEETDFQKFSGFVEEWRVEIQKLMEWLDWPMWVRCSPRCDELREMCYLPMWPWVKGGWGYYEPDGPSLEPKCIPKFPPYPLFLDNPV